MVELDELPSSLKIGYIFFATLADILFLWLLHLTSIRLPRPQSNGEWNKPQNECNRCFCSPFTPQYAAYFFDDTQEEVVSKSDQELVTLSVNLMKNGSEQDEDDPLQTTDHTKEEKEPEQDTKDTITVDPIHIKIRSTRKPCCCYYFSFLWRIWNAICGVLALAISAGFHFNIILEFMIRCSAFFLESDHTGASFAGVFGFFALYFLLSIPLWCGKQFLHAFWIMFMNTADKNRMLFVEWYRLFHVLWC
eukprot:386994_1